jgi:WD40 repeat protein
VPPNAVESPATADNRDPAVTNHASRSSSPIEHKFDVFISYSRRDAAFARRLQRALDSYTPPSDLPLPQRRLRTFRDESDFLGNEYTTALHSMLTSSATLLVICSPDSRASAYVGGEIATFAATRGKDHIVTVLRGGRPNNEAGVAESEKAFHDELVARLPVPLAADYRGFDDTRDRADRDPFESAWFKLLADIYAGYGVERSAIEGREKARQRRVRRIRAAVVSGVMVVLAALTVWALLSRNEAIRQGNTARSRFLAMQSMSGTHPFDMAMLLAVAAHRIAPTFEAWEALFVGLQRQPRLRKFLHGADGVSADIVISADGRCAAAWMSAEQTVIWDVRSGARIHAVPGRALPDGNCGALVVASETGDLETRSLPADERRWTAPSPSGPLTAWAFDPSGSLLAVAHAGGRLLVRDMQTGQIRAQRATQSSTWRYLRFSTDGHSLAAIDHDNVVHRWDAAMLDAPPKTGRCSTESANVFAISPDLRWCAAGREGYFVVSDLHVTGGQIDMGPEWILALDFSPDGRTLMAGVQGGGLQFRSVAEIARSGRGARVSSWSEHRSDVTAAAYSQDGNALVSASRDGAVIVWNPGTSHRLVSELTLAPAPGALAANPNASVLAMATSAGEVLVSGDGSARSFERLGTAGGEVTALAVDRVGNVIAGTADGRVLAMRRSATPRAFPVQNQGRITRIQLDTDGTRAVVIGENGGATLWDVNTATRVSEFRGTERESTTAFGGGQAAFEPGGPRIALVPGGQHAFLWNPVDQVSHPSPLAFQPQSFFNSVAFAPGGGMIAVGTGMYEEEIVLLDIGRGGEPIARLPSHNEGKVAVTALAFSGDGRLLFAGLFDGATSVWDVAGRRRIGDIYPARGSIITLSFSDDGSTVTALSDQGVVLRWNMAPDAWRDMACAIANRDVSSEERARFLDGGSVSAVCP